MDWRLLLLVPPRSRPSEFHSTRQLFTLLAGMLLAFPSAAPGQWQREPESGGRIASLGQPLKTRWQAGIATGAVRDRTDHELALRAQFGFTRDLMNPVAGLASMSVEGYLGVRGSAPDAGARVLFPVPYFGAGAGVDYNIRDRDFSLVITAFSPLRRGGIVVPGGLARADWYPARQSLTLGVTAPVGDRLAGRGRPLRDYVVVAADFQPPVRYRIRDAEIAAALDSVRTSAEWIRRHIVPFLDQDGRREAISLQRTERSLNELKQRLAVRSVEQEIRHFHAQLDQAFVRAANSEEAGGKLARGARTILLDDVILPYNRLLGRKKRHDTLADLATVARGRFSRWAVSSGIVPADRTDHVLFVFQQLTSIIDEIRKVAAREWDDPRLVWLPLQLALLPEEHDEQAELDALLERATNVPFRGPSHIRYVANLQFHWELLRSIQETRNYHVLWIHDFPAVTSTGYDSASLSQVADGYLTTLATHIEAYDTGGTIPTFFIFLDQHYYEERKSRLLMSVLEDPLGASLAARPGIPGNTDQLRTAQERLRAAVRASRMLNAEARQYGQAWLRNRVKIHVNVTNRSDPSFWSGSLVATLFGYPDNVMRDHRKIVFRDVSEADPAEGVAILTGMGVGQNYLDPSWEDRALIMSGSVLVELKHAARDMLLTQGMPEEDLPLPLRSSPAAAETARAAAHDDLDQYAMVLVNGTGYLAKPLNVGKAFLYSMLPSGSVMKIPDSLWNSSFFGALLVGACLRGARVSVVAPADANAPSRGFVQMARARELLGRLLLARRELADAMRGVGGELHVGLYALPVDDNGFASRAARWADQVANQPALQTLMPFGADVLAVVADAATAGSVGFKASNGIAGAPREPPRLHMKVQFIATRELWESITNSPAWPTFMSTYLTYRRATYRTSDSQAAADPLPAELARIAQSVFEPACDRAGAAAYAIVGSQNQDYRGMFMDGEVGVLFTGFQALVPLLDLTFVEGTATWLETQADLDRLIPPVGEMKRRFARIAKDAV